MKYLYLLLLVIIFIGTRVREDFSYYTPFWKGYVVVVLTMLIAIAFNMDKVYNSYSKLLYELYEIIRE